MSWLSGLAGKAEDLLNKIDQNAAIALQKGSGPQIAVDSVLVEVSSQGDSCSLKKTAGTNNSASRHGGLRPLPAVKSFPNLRTTSLPFSQTESSGKLKSSAAADEDELMKFLNSPKTENKTRKNNGAVDGGGVEEVALALPAQQNIPRFSMVSKAKKNSDMEVNAALKQSRGELCIEVSSGGGADAFEEFGVLSSEDGPKMELMAKEQEVLGLQGKLRESQLEVDQLRNRLKSMEVRLTESQEMYSRAIEDSKKIAEAAIAGRFQAETELDRLKNEFSYSMDDKTRTLEVLKSKMEGELVAANNRTSSLQRRYDALVEELRGERLEQERYRARAQAVLAGRDREIAELRSRGAAKSEHGVESEAIESEQEKERQMWEQEVLQLREEALHLRHMLEEGRRQWEGEREHLEEELVVERGRREATEEQEKATLQELRNVRAEVDRLRQGELELRQKLCKEEEERKGGGRRKGGEWQGGGRAVLAQDAVDDSVSERLASLTSTLIEKQVRVESLTAERNALRLQLEKTDHLYRDAIAHLGQGSSSSSMPGQNDTDDVKARIPSFLLESPFDTAVARKVKRAYSSLDSVGVRVGLFLRRYPLARTLLLSYTVLLHLWVVVVLLTYTPDVH